MKIPIRPESNKVGESPIGYVYLIDEHPKTEQIIQLLAVGIAEICVSSIVDKDGKGRIVEVSIVPRVMPPGEKALR